MGFEFKFGPEFGAKKCRMKIKRHKDVVQMDVDVVGHVVVGSEDCAVKIIVFFVDKESLSIAVVCDIVHKLVKAVDF